MVQRIVRIKKYVIEMQNKNPFKFVKISGGTIKVNQMN